MTVSPDALDPPSFRHPQRSLPARSWAFGSRSACPPATADSPAGRRCPSRRRRLHRPAGCAPVRTNAVGRRATSPRRMSHNPHRPHAGSCCSRRRGAPCRLPCRDGATSARGLQGAEVPCCHRDVSSPNAGTNHGVRGRRASGECRPCMRGDDDGRTPGPPACQGGNPACAGTSISRSPMRGCAARVPAPPYAETRRVRSAGHTHGRYQPCGVTGSTLSVQGQALMGTSAGRGRQGVSLPPQGQAYGQSAAGRRVPNQPGCQPCMRRYGGERGSDRPASQVSALRARRRGEVGEQAAVGARVSLACARTVRTGPFRPGSPSRQRGLRRDLRGSPSRDCSQDVRCAASVRGSWGRTDVLVRGGGRGGGWLRWWVMGVRVSGCRSGRGRPMWWRRAVSVGCRCSRGGSRTAPTGCSTGCSSICWTRRRSRWSCGNASSPGARGS